MKRAVEPIIEATSLKKKNKQTNKGYINCINYLSVFLNFSEIEKSKDLNKNCHLNIKNAKNHYLSFLRSKRGQNNIKNFSMQKKSQYLLSLIYSLKTNIVSCCCYCYYYD